MKIRELFDQIESKTFVVEANLASGASGFIEAVSSNPAIVALSEEEKQNPYVSGAVLQRIELLANLKVDYRYENPHDAALAAYAWLLFKNAPHLATIAAAILIEARQVWWARHVAGYILESEASSKSARNTRTASIIDITPVIGIETYSVTKGIMEAQQNYILVGLFEGSHRVEIVEHSTNVYLLSPAGTLESEISWGELQGLRQTVDLKAESSSSGLPYYWHSAHG